MLQTFDLDHDDFGLIQSKIIVIRGLVAEWLRRGLQILAPQFDSGRGLQFPTVSRRAARRNQ